MEASIPSLSALKEKVVYIVSPMKLQNTLMASYLEKVTGMQCVTIEDVSDIPPQDDKAGREERLILWDCLGNNLKHCLSEISGNNDRKLNLEPICIFNLHRNQPIEEENLVYGVKGLFYMGDSIEQFLKGIQAIFEGELWLPRKIMSQYILKNQIHPFPTDECMSKHLTRREIEILTMIAQGTSNSMIADQLCISPHTVKTHIYNIFKKIEVPNRLQAAFWAIKNI